MKPRTIYFEITMWCIDKHMIIVSNNRDSTVRAFDDHLKNKCYVLFDSISAASAYLLYDKHITILRVYIHWRLIVNTTVSSRLCGQTFSRWTLTTHNNPIIFFRDSLFRTRKSWNRQRTILCTTNERIVEAYLRLFGFAIELVKYNIS